MASAQGAGRAILLIEDDQAIGTLIGEILADEGYATTVATTLAAGLALLARQPFDLVLADSFAGDGVSEDRWLGLEQIRRAAEDIPTIILTAHRAEQFGDYVARGFAAILEKPFDLDSLLLLLDDVLSAGERRAIQWSERRESSR